MLWPAQRAAIAAAAPAMVVALNRLAMRMASALLSMRRACAAAHPAQIDGDQHQRHGGGELGPADQGYRAEVDDGRSSAR